MDTEHGGGLAADTIVARTLAALEVVGASGVTGLAAAALALSEGGLDGGQAASARGAFATAALLGGAGALASRFLGPVVVKVAAELADRAKGLFFRRDVPGMDDVLRSLPLAAAIARTEADRRGKLYYYVREPGHTEFRQVDAAEHARFKALYGSSDEPLMTIGLSEDNMSLVTTVRGRLQSVPGVDGEPFPAIMKLARRDGVVAVVESRFADNGQFVASPAASDATAARTP